MQRSPKVSKILVPLRSSVSPLGRILENKLALCSVVYFLGHALPVGLLVRFSFVIDSLSLSPRKRKLGMGSIPLNSNLTHKPGVTLLSTHTERRIDTVIAHRPQTSEARDSARKGLGGWENKVQARMRTGWVGGKVSKILVPLRSSVSPLGRILENKLALCSVVYFLGHALPVGLLVRFSFVIDSLSLSPRKRKLGMGSIPLNSNLTHKPGVTLLSTHTERRIDTVIAHRPLPA